jgi:phospholipase C
MTHSIADSGPETADGAGSGDAFAAAGAALALFAAPRRVCGALLHRAMVGPLYTRAAESARPVPALSTLATNFVLCDEWFAEVPGPTMPSRLYIHAATSVGWARNDWSVPLDSVTIYEQLQRNQRTWAVYFSDQNEVAQYNRINTQRANFKLYESAFAADASAGKLANYCFIIPRFAGCAADGPVTSMHPPQDVRPGDQLIADVYAAVRGGPQ